MSDASQMIVVNLPVRDLEACKAFFAALGDAFNPTFTDHNAACMIVSDSIFVMLLAEPFFAGVTSKPISDAQVRTEIITALSAPSRAAVDAPLQKALAAGAREPQAPRDYGFMCQRGFADPDGHLWEIAHMSGTTG